MPIIWNDGLSIGIAEIDEQHKALAGLINNVELLAKMNPDDTIFPKQFRALYTGLLNYTVLHFATEEVLMKTFDYADYKEHKSSHETFILVTKIRLKNCTNLLLSARHDELQKELKMIYNFLEDWIVKHILKSDAEYSGYFLSIKKKSKKSGGWLNILSRL